MARLKFVKGTHHQGVAVELDQDRFVIGRDKDDCQIVIPEASVSRKHALVRRIQGKFYVEDLTSRNHTYLNDDKDKNKIQTRTLLKDHDQIIICGHHLAFYETEPKPDLPEHLKAKAIEAEDEDNSTVEATLQPSSSKQILEAQPAERLTMLLEIGVELTQTIKTDDLLPKIVDKLFQVFRQADRGFIIMKDETKLYAQVTKTRRQGEEDKTNFSRKIVNRTMDTGQAILSEDASADKNFDMSQSIADCKIRSMVCAPLLSRGDGPAFGVIQLDTQDRFKKFTQDDLRLLMAVAAQAGVAIENARLHESLVSRVELERDLELARRVQMSFLPKKFPQVAGYEFFAHYESAQEVGGDYYDFIPLPNGRLGVMIGDVAGKGVPAALLMAKVSSDARFCTLTEASLSDAINKLNDHMQEAGMLDRFVTFGACLIDLALHTLMVVNAGHPPPLIYRAGMKSFEDGCTKDQTGYPLGIVEGTQYEGNTITLAPGDCVVLFTDGISESRSKEEKEFGMSGVLSALNGGPMGPKAMGQRLVETVHRHATGRKAHDDLTVVTFGRLP